MQEFVFEKRLMGTDLIILIFSDSEREAEELARKSFELTEKYENIFSRFKENSELSILNRKKEILASEIF